MAAVEIGGANPLSHKSDEGMEILIQNVQELCRLSTLDNQYRVVVYPDTEKSGYVEVQLQFGAEVKCLWFVATGKIGQAYPELMCRTVDALVQKMTLALLATGSNRSQ